MSIMEYEREITNMISGICLINELMSKHTTYGIGGPVPFYIKPKNKKELINILLFAKRKNIPVNFVGSGSNLLVCDSGIEGIVVSLEKSMRKITFLSETVIYVESGAMLGKLVKLSISNNLTGLESLIGIPGTLGGALVMNAGAFGREISKCLQFVDVIKMNGTEKQYSSKNIRFQYRSSSFSKNEIIIGASFILKKDDPINIEKKRQKASQGRKSSQPLRVRSAGSIFKNPENTAAGYLIDQAGLKGTVKGGAEISSIHANFFVNNGDATSDDLVSLIRLTRKKVSKLFGIYLDLEIKTLGFPKGTFEA